MQKCAIINPSPSGVPSPFASRCLRKSRSWNTLHSESVVNISHYAYECFGATRRYAWRRHVPAALSPPVIEDAAYRAALTISLNEVRVPRTRGDNASARIYDSASGVGEARDRCIILSHACHSESQPPSPPHVLAWEWSGDQWSPSVRTQSHFRWFPLPHWEIMLNLYVNLTSPNCRSKWFASKKELVVFEEPPSSKLKGVKEKVDYVHENRKKILE